MKFFLKIILWLAVIVFAGMLAASLIAGYNASMSFLVSLLHEEARADKILRLISGNKFLLLQVILFIVTIAPTFLLSKFNAAWQFISHYSKNFRISFVQVFRETLQPGNRLIFILPF